MRSIWSSLRDIADSVAKADFTQAELNKIDERPCSSKHATYYRAGDEYCPKCGAKLAPLAKCDMCKRCFFSKKAYYYHLRVEHKESFKCPFCKIGQARKSFDDLVDKRKSFDRHCNNCGKDWSVDPKDKTVIRQSRASKQSETWLRKRKERLKRLKIKEEDWSDYQ